MTKTALYYLVSSELTSQTDALDDEEVREISKAISQKIAEECPDIVEEDENVILYDENSEEG